MTTFEECREAALGLPQAHEEMTWGEHTFRVGRKIFAMGGDEPDGGRLSVKASPEEQTALVASDPGTFSVAPYVGRFGWVRIDLAGADLAEVAELLAEAWRRTAPRRLVKTFDEARGTGRES